MSYDSLENSVQDSKPIELYSFKVGPAFYRYTNAQETINADLEDGFFHNYLPIEIDRTQPEQSKELQRTALTVTLPRDAGIASLFVEFVPSVQIGLTIFRFHDGDSNFIKLWAGRVQAVEFKESFAEIACHPTLMSMKRAGLRKTFGATCQHTLYDAGCQVDKETSDYKFVGIVGSATANQYSSEVVFTTDDPSHSSGWYDGGVAIRTSNGETRLITFSETGFSGNVRILTLLPFTGHAFLNGEEITIYAGCRHDIETCFDKFNTTENPDAANFYGFHVNPKRNPFKTGLK